MNEKFSRENLSKNRDTKKLSEHLDLSIKGARPIIAHIGTEDEVGRIRDDSYQEADNIKHNDYDANLAKGFLQTENAKCVISKIDSSNKFSLDFYRCTGLVVAGIDKNNGKHISFLSHQDPNAFLLDQKDDFVSMLNEQLSEMKKRCIPGTIDAVIVGGNYPPDRPKEQQVYLNSISFISYQVKQVLGFEPIIINGPKESELRTDDIYYENEHRRLTFRRSKVNSEIGSFTSNDLEKTKTDID